MRQFLANPQRLRQLGYAFALTGAALAAIGTLVRDVDDGATWSYILDAGSWLLAVAGAVAEARVCAIFSAFQPQPARRRATILFGLGIAVALAMCIALSVLNGDDPAVATRSVAAALLVGGIWAGLGGGFSLAATIGARYAADRLANLDET